MIAALFSSFLGVLHAASVPKTVYIQTEDGWTLAAAYRPPKKGRPVAVLVHGVASGKGEWWRLDQQLSRRGIGTLAVDLRGHGGSLQGPRGRQDYREFDLSGEWLRMEEDVEAALRFLNKRGVGPRRVGLAGASIGANLVWRAAAKRKVAWVALLSPGADYRGVTAAARFQEAPVLIAASAADSYSYQTAAALAARAANARLLEAPGGHGVQMFDEEKILNEAAEWIDKNSP